jgi:signal transduction histidine kinase
LQTWYGLRPLRRSATRSRGCARAKTRSRNRCPPRCADGRGINALLAHNDRQAEEARRHAGNLAHALKTPLTVIMNAATPRRPILPTP